jgi:hypothetical protein
MHRELYVLAFGILSVVTNVTADTEKGKSCSPARSLKV